MVEMRQSRRKKMKPRGERKRRKTGLRGERATVGLLHHHWEV